MAYRGCGFALIELGQLDDARYAYMESLEFDADSKIALAEIEYIEGLCRGAAPRPARTVEVELHDLTQCQSCGVRSLSGTFRGLTFICDQCGPRGKKPWWAFWRAG
jgi:hypothetical protein